MAPKIFATGVTGYVGGDVLHELLERNPSLESSITALVRSPERGQSLSARYPKIKLVYGSLGDGEVIEEEASKADIVLHWASCDHVGAVQAIKRGLEKGPGAIWIHTSGIDILLPPGKDGKQSTGGLEAGSKVYDDWDGIKDCLALPETHSHGPPELIVRSTMSLKIKVAIICPPTVWGLSRGTGNTRSHQIYNLASIILSRGKGIKIPFESPEKLFWPDIHIHDLTEVFLLVIQDSISEVAGKKGKATWNAEGYYFAENGRFYWQQVADWITEQGYQQGFLESDTSSTIDRSDLTQVGVALWNTKYGCKSIRANKLWGWVPKGKKLEDEIPAIVASEAKRLGLEKKTK